MKADLYNKKAEKIGTVELPNRIFARKWSPQLVHQALLAQTANSRENVAHSKGRDEVKGGGKKPYAQKHTGRARHGSIRSPIFRGGGVAHGPSKTRDFSVKINKKMRQAALFSLMSRKLNDGDIMIVESLALETSKTKEVFSFLKAFTGKVSGVKKSTLSVLMIPALENRSIYKAARNIPKVKSLGPKSLNVYDLLKYKHVLVDKGAVEAIAKTYNINNETVK
ncbi:MAG: 50S ribosomal protein L4 [Candidatus Colwellbacteria bacterium RIFCSPLOWO2_01_FULL_48_10]|uniref:Large ribosomal subunit protein uL4 n=1 Tax=Candidatus Colwellbacteria bacterium RIFCSPLOWO2_01_FULL_48_10 TaxID=1797690 RepID=A0A1G1Z6N6_9BACT|nr:MAG: 50S ribosomal protein L4 [Candidatus Colwellbacteria bacterium RIFCSPLOWO2_01_FULL_48_10]